MRRVVKDMAIDFQYTLCYLSVSVCKNQAKWELKHACQTPLT